jgi:hypothetical protein
LCSDDQLSGGAHGDGADGMPGHTERGGDGRDGGSVDHQPPQNISRASPRCAGPRRSEAAEVLMEHAAITVGDHAAVARHRYLQYQRVAGHRQIG